jgi:secreted PhoX family phosphatase
MDRPEDIEVSPKTGKVYVTLTNNSERTATPQIKEVNGREVQAGTDESNPRGNNQHGHVLEMIEADGDGAALTFAWNILVKCGDPTVASHDTSFGDVADPVQAGVSPISDPDNLVHDDDGNLWIATDGEYYSGSVGFGQNDGISAVPVEGPDRGLLRQLLSGVPGGEVCGPEFSGDNRTLFCAMQHPYEGKGVNHSARWPIDEPVVSKPGLIAVREKNGRKIGK